MKRLTRNDWLDFSLKQLSRHGHTQLTANRLAAKLGVSRGSFYWHFKDLHDFEKSLLARWADRSTEDVIDDLTHLRSARLRLSSLITRAMDGNLKLERAIRSWGTSSKHVAKTIENVDRRRIEYIEEILRTTGVSDADIHTRAQMLYWASIGRMLMPELGSENLSQAQLNRFADLLIS